MALAIAGFAVYRGYASFIERRSVTELALPGMGRELGIGLLIGAGLYAACELMLMALGGLVTAADRRFRRRPEETPA